MKMGQTPGYLGSWDLDDQPNREITLTIDKIVDEKLNANGQSEVCTVCHWAEKDVPPMVWNVTNKKIVAKPGHPSPVTHFSSQILNTQTISK